MQCPQQISEHYVNVIFDAAPSHPDSGCLLGSSVVWAEQASPPSLHESLPLSPAPAEWGLVKPCRNERPVWPPQEGTAQNSSHSYAGQGHLSRTSVHLQGGEFKMVTENSKN